MLLAGDDEDAIDQLQAEGTHSLPHAAGGDTTAPPAPASTADNIGPRKNASQNGILKETVLGSRFGGGSTGAAVNRHLSRKASVVDDVPRTVSPSLVSICLLIQHTRMPTLSIPRSHSKHATHTHR